MIIIVGDCNSTSAQGVRYTALFGRLSISTKKMICYSPQCCEIETWDKISVKISTSLIAKTLNRIQRRAIYPDAYMARLHSYKKRLNVIINDNAEGNIIIGCTPFSLMLLAPWIKRKIPNVNLIVDMSDPFSFNMGNINNRFRVWIAQKIEMASFPHIDHIVVLNEGISNKYQSMYPLWAGKFEVIEQGIDEDFIRRVRVDSPGSNGKKLIKFLYAGGFYRRGRNPNEMFKAFSKLSEDCELSIYGNIRRYIRPKGTENIEYHRAIDKERLADITAQADALVLMDNEYGYQVPGKTLETLSSGKPVLFIYNNEESPTLKYVREAKGVVWAKNNAADIENGIMKIVNGDYETPYFDYSPYTWEKMQAKYKLILG